MEKLGLASSGPNVGTHSMVRLLRKSCKERGAVTALKTAPPRSLLLVHGAGTGPWVFDGWREDFPGITVAAVDLHEALEVATASHADYATKVADAARALPTPVSLCGWSMGGLAVLQAAGRVRPHSVILLEPSPPAEVQGYNPNSELGQGTFNPEAVYGVFPAGMRARPESKRARDERKRGISVPSLPCASLVVYGDAFREERGKPVARLYGSDELDFPGLDHWGLVSDVRVRAKIAEWLAAAHSTPHPADVAAVEED
jgi:pimeloyl-ACP methyl ester carboxylesterase